MGEERSVWRKIREAIIALRLDRHHSKEAILEAYLNTIYLGEGAYGVEAASSAYFGRGAADVDLAQAALLELEPERGSGPGRSAPPGRSEPSPEADAESDPERDPEGEPEGDPDPGPGVDLPPLGPGPDDGEPGEGEPGEGAAARRGIARGSRKGAGPGG